MADLRPAARIPLLVLGMLSLVVGMLAGLARRDWSMPATATVVLLLFIGTLLASVVRGSRETAVPGAG